MGKAIRVLWLAVLVPLVGAGACQLGGTAPDDMSVEGHRQHADEHRVRADEHEDRYDPDITVEPYPGRPAGSDRSDPDYRYSGDYYWGGRAYNPTARHLAHSERHQAHAREHLAAARALEQFDEAQCRAFPPETRALCPLIGQVEAVENVDGGSRIRFAESVDVNAAVAHLRCHLAFARSGERAEVDACPLYLPGLRVLRVGNGSEVDFLVDDEGALDPLRSRLRAHVGPEPR